MDTKGEASRMSVPYLFDVPVEELLDGWRVLVQLGERVIERAKGSFHTGVVMVLHCFRGGTDAQNVNCKAEGENASESKEGAGDRILLSAAWLVVAHELRLTPVAFWGKR